MLNQILARTPIWVWALLAALLWLGLSQTVNRTASLKRITVMPLVMIGLSLFGTVSVFGSDAQLLLAWLVAGALMATLMLQKAPNAAIRYDASSRLFTLPGSWVPLALILGIFVTKYVVGFMTAMQPELRHELGFSLSCATLYGAFSGIFLARALRLWQLAYLAEKPGVKHLNRA